MASNVCFCGAVGRLALGHAPSPGINSPGPPAPQPPTHPGRGLCVQGHNTEADWEAWLRDRRSNPSAGDLSSSRRGTAGPLLGTAVAGFWAAKRGQGDVLLFSCRGQSHTPWKDCSRRPGAFLLGGGGHFWELGAGDRSSHRAKAVF